MHLEGRRLWVARAQRAVMAVPVAFPRRAATTSRTAPKPMSIVEATALPAKTVMDVMRSTTARASSVTPAHARPAATPRTAPMRLAPGATRPTWAARVFPPKRWRSRAPETPSVPRASARTTCAATWRATALVNPAWPPKRPLASPACAVRWCRRQTPSTNAESKCAVVATRAWISVGCSPHPPAARALRHATAVAPAEFARSTAPPETAVCVQRDLRAASIALVSTHATAQSYRVRATTRAASRAPAILDAETPSSTVLRRERVP